MKNISSKEIRSTVIDSLTQALIALEVPTASKKTGKVIERAAKKITSEVKRIVKKETRKEKKAAMKTEKLNGKTKKAKRKPGKEVLQ